MTNDIQTNKRKAAGGLWDLAYCLVAALVIMLICTRSSPLYPFNNWDDTNSYFTVGKSIFKGLVPYRDLFDQKGPMHYFLYAIASLISYNSFTGVFIIELIAAAAMIGGIIRILELYLTREVSMILAAVTAALVYSSRAFWWGGSAEEMLLPFLVWGLYISMRYFRERYPMAMSRRDLVTGGILAGCVLNIKFSSLGFYFAWMLMVLIADLVRGKESLGAKLLVCIRHGLLFLLGMLIATIPWIIYFAINGAVMDWLYVYFYLNIFVYSEKLPIAERLINMLKVLYFHSLDNPGSGLTAIAGGAAFLLFKGRVIEKVNVLMQAIFLVLVIYIGGVKLPYYYLPVCTFTVLAALAVGRAYTAIVGTVARGIPMGISSISRFCLPLFAMIASAIISTSMSMNISFMKYHKDDLWMYHFARIIEESGIEDPTLLNVQCFDAGLYTTTGIVPTCRFFQTQTINLTDVEEVQWDYIRNGRTDFVLSRNGDPEHIYEQYELIASEDLEWEGEVNTYLLYSKK
ncbi:hypothetical protein [Butyrivibrio sp. MC2013]|uniref:hypothetical protein n=1 Tax=Butyrivibrio sp. MC2013 TaxID=1280686 RepID=UPI0018CB6572|nr:hypothetical protein [Butyrivibrio sp. MC2013]